MNVLIVEGKTDKEFLDYLIENVLSIPNIKIKDPPISINIQELGGLSQKALEKQIGSIIPKIASDSIKKLGIAIDLDTLETDGGFDKRLELVNKSIKEAFAESLKSSGNDVNYFPKLLNINQFITITINDNTKIEIACFFIHLDRKGELEDILRKIKTHESHHADCLESWRTCLKSKNIEKTEKDINKLWIDSFIRYDICNPKERKDGNTCCNLKYILNDKAREGKIFNFNHEALDELKEFLYLFA